MPRVAMPHGVSFFEPRPMPITPQFLVSIRNANECEAAHFGGADIIDVKEPNNGPLGMADLDALRQIRDRLHSINPDRKSVV